LLQAVIELEAWALRGDADWIEVHKVMKARWKDRFGSAVLVPELEQARKRYRNMISEHKKVLEAERQTGSGDRGDDDDDDDDEYLERLQLLDEILGYMEAAKLAKQDAKNSKSEAAEYLLRSAQTTMPVAPVSPTATATTTPLSVAVPRQTTPRKQKLDPFALFSERQESYLRVAQQVLDSEAVRMERQVELARLRNRELELLCKLEMLNNQW
jgi:hypothetical protein